MNNYRKFIGELNTKSVKNKGVTIDNLRDEYLKIIDKTHSKAYYISVQCTFNLFIAFTGNCFIKQLSVKQVETFILSKYKSHKHAAALHYRNLRAAFNKAITWGYIKENPCSKFRLPKVPKTFPCFIEQDQLLKIIDKTEQQVFKDIFIFLFFTGCRAGECVNLKWKSVSLRDKYLTVEITETFMTKGKAERHIPLNKTVLALLKERYYSKFNSPDNYVFCKDNGFPYTVNRASRIFREAVQEAGLDSGIHLHTLRHSFASQLINNGAGLNVVKELLGHSDIRTTQVYMHVNKADLQRGVNLLDKGKNNQIYKSMVK